MSTAEVLAAMRSLLADERKWTKGVLAQDDTGRVTLPRNGDAARFCVRGAAYRVCPDQLEIFSAFTSLLGVVERRHGYDALIDFNDSETTTHGMVLEALDEAIALEKSFR